MKKIGINLNDMVEFTLTQEGADTINAHRENLLIELGRLDEVNKKKVPCWRNYSVAVMGYGRHV